MVQVLDSLTLYTYRSGVALVSMPLGLVLGSLSVDFDPEPSGRCQRDPQNRIKRERIRTR